MYWQKTPKFIGFLLLDDRLWIEMFPTTKLSSSLSSYLFLSCDYYSALNTKGEGAIADIVIM